ncbi:signal peptidase I [Enterococcus sp. 7F3_DIV0205]|uniref:Signal peptidase I n=1 Tax=Candidatus Enterococcus palustris TaxID=1834189 RepID=A0AAQ3W952_9ENTE|nr:signal peptidase I [Enterococcus sp. 7F3_DIV0205]OTN82570.1 signal peptidase I [Enterococcus sp. 7F3_DIV0205]
MYKEKKKILLLFRNKTKFFSFFFMIVCLCFLIFVKTHQVDGHSMQPTLTNGDRILVLKGKKMTSHDLITFNPKDDPRKIYVKRVIGVPGNEIRIDEKRLTIVTTSNQDEKKKPLFDGDLASGITEVSVTKEVSRLLEHMTTIPEDKYFVLGDNRNDSRDSRQLGLIDRSQIEGIVVYRYYPISKMGFLNE